MLRVASDLLLTTLVDSFRIEKNNTAPRDAIHCVQLRSLSLVNRDVDMQTFEMRIKICILVTENVTCQHLDLGNT